MFRPHLVSTGDLVESTAGRPRAIRTGGRRVAISAVESVRDETAAYPLQQGPRQVFVVLAAGQRYRLEHRLRERHWMLESLGRDANLLPDAA